MCSQICSFYRESLICLLLFYFFLAFFCPFLFFVIYSSSFDYILDNAESLKDTKKIICNSTRPSTVFRKLVSRNRLLYYFFPFFWLATINENSLPFCRLYVYQFYWELNVSWFHEQFYCGFISLLPNRNWSKIVKMSRFSFCGLQYAFLNQFTWIYGLANIVFFV